jgi:uridine phosphorylase
MRSAVGGRVAFEREDGVVGARRLFSTADGLLVAHSCPGAPAAVSLVEVLVAAGVGTVLILGEAGSVSPEVGVSDVVVPTFAVREEGTSYHYLPPGSTVKPSDSLLGRLRELLSREGIPFKEGGVWTTDAPFRETPGKVLRYSKAGVLAVDMECSAVFSVAAYRKVDAAAVLVVVDTLWGGTWRPAFNDPRVVDVERRVSELVAIEWGKLVVR